MNKLKSLTWKYFWKQKWKEIANVLFIIFIILGVLGLVVQAGWLCKYSNSVECGNSVKCICKVPYESTFPQWIMYSGFVTTGIWIMIGLVYWISSNWKEAKRKAKNEIGGKK